MTRYMELDIIKGIAVILMVIFHIFYLMNNMGFTTLDPNGNFLSTMAQISHYAFIIVAGMNIFLSYKKTNDKKKYKKNKLKRSFNIFIYAMIITLVSYLGFGGRKFVKFGILHFISVSIILSIITVDKPNLNLLLFPILILLGNIIQQNSSKINNFCSKNSLMCFIFGIIGPYMYKYNGTMDHFDILSKYPFFLLGMGLGHLFLESKKKSNKKIKKNIITNSLSWLGIYSLEIYMIHWFVIYGILYLLGGRPIY